MTISPTRTMDDLEEVRRLLDDRPAGPVDTEIRKVSETKDGELIDLSFGGRTGRRVLAYLVRPSSARAGPAVLMVHPARMDRSFFLIEAEALVRSNFTSLLIEAPWTSTSWGASLGEPQHDRAEFIGIARDLRRAVDLLVPTERTGDARIGYLGMSLGALFGGLLSGVDERINAFVLMSGLGSFADVAARNMPDLKGEKLAIYQEKLSPLDPIRYVGQAAPAKLFFQYGNQDVFPQEKLAAFAAAGSSPKLVRTYDAGHFLNEQARGDAVQWLAENL